MDVSYIVIASRYICIMTKGIKHDEYAFFAVIAYLQNKKEAFSQK